MICKLTNTKSKVETFGVCDAPEVGKVFRMVTPKIQSSDLNLIETSLITVIHDEGFRTLNTDYLLETVKDTNIHELIRLIIYQLRNIKWTDGDIADVGNEVGIALQKYLILTDQKSPQPFFSGMKHGISLIDGTH